jgi:hypothetical protein
MQAIWPGLLLGSLLFGFLALVDFAIGERLGDSPAFYVVVMAILALTFHACAFLLLPLRALQSETERLRKLMAGALAFFRRRRP